ncbi:MAG: hypothetical protein Ct9H300mP11_10680 [Chloroflexota bacterium]|nr:MAG: hypothetical protein Ct9H300mP11_10680 [Chloroflexota bacterium]
MNVGTSVPLPAYTIDRHSGPKTAEDLGFESIWYAEHAAVPVHSEARSLLLAVKYLGPIPTSPTLTSH